MNNSTPYPLKAAHSNSQPLGTPNQKKTVPEEMKPFSEEQPALQQTLNALSALKYNPRPETLSAILFYARQQETVH